MKARRFRNFATALSVAALLPAGAAFAETTLRVVGHAALKMLDPVNTTAYITRNHGYFIYDTLFSIDDSFAPQPQMVDTWAVSADGLTYSFTLREGLAFHNGAPVTAEDCIASIQRWAQRDAIGKRMAKHVEAMTATGATSFEITLSSKFGALIDGFAKPSSLPLFIMPANIAATPASEQIKTYIGSGPFKFVADDFQPGVRAVYEKNADYVPRVEPASGLAGGKVVKVDRVEYLSFPDSQTVVNALKQGEVDMVESVTPDMAKQLADDKDVVIAATAAKFVPVVRFNWLQPPFNDPKARQAVLYGLSQYDFMAAQIGDEKYYQICGAMFGCGTQLETEVGAVQTAEYPDLKKAKELLAQSNYKGEKVIVLQPTDLPTLSAIPPLMVQVLQQIGFNAEAAPMDWASYLQRRNSQAPVADGGWSVAFGSWNMLDLVSPISNLNLDTAGAEGYAGWSSDPVMAELKDAFAAAESVAEKKQLAEEIQKRAYELVFAIPLGTWSRTAAWGQNIHGRINAPVSIYWNVSKD